MPNSPAQHCSTRHALHRCAHRRKGTILIVVLAASLIVSVLALGALVVRRVERRRLREQQDLATARLYALAAVEMALWHTSSDANWRQNMAAGVWASDRPIGAGYYSFTASDPDDGDLTDADDDPVVIVATGKCGAAVQHLQVTLLPEIRGLSCLEVSLHAGDKLDFKGGLVSDQIVSTNSDAQQSGEDTILADVEAVGSITLNNHVGNATEGIAPREMPEEDKVFDYYIDHATANGTLLAISQLPDDGSDTYLLENVVLSPQNNPYGSGNTSPEGIYVVDCQGEDIVVRNARIVGTLVLLDPGSNSQIAAQLHWQPAVANYPALLVRGSMQFSFTGGTLQEATASANFNPSGTPFPYPGGTTDSDQTDSYPSAIKGPVYVLDLYANGSSPIFGPVVVGKTFTATQSQSLTLTYDGTYLADPPPGFAAPVKMKLDPASWRQVVD